MSAGELTPVGVTDLIKTALESGTPDAVAQIEKLVTLAERVDDRNKRTAFNRAYAAFRDECPAIAKTALGEVPTRDGGKWQWAYAPLDGIQKVVDPLLKKHGLFYRFSNTDVSEREMTVECIVVHKDGHSEATRVTISKGGANSKMSKGQQDAGTLTIAQRRSLGMALGLQISDTETAPNETGEVINDEELSDLEGLIETTGTDKARYLRWLGVESLADLPASEFFRAKNALLGRVKDGSGD